MANIALKFCMKAQNRVQADKNKKFFGVDSGTLMELKVGEGILAGLTENNLKIKIRPTWERNGN
ncbi:MAG: hypothetical protein OIN88_01010 [Candidatus Methanoperedens sp.]|nr:hypothetical protein [Candidatus Methanoperedens sp.]